MNHPNEGLPGVKERRPAAESTRVSSWWRRSPGQPADDGLAALRRDGYTVVHDLRRDAELVSGSNGVFLVDLRAGATIADVRRKAAELQVELHFTVTPVLCTGDRTFRNVGVLVAAHGELAEAIRSVPPKRQLAPERLARFGHSLKV
jgi:hypothetical protein